jgi:hypothetical protein
MTYKPEEVIDLRSRALDAQGPSADRFETDFMKFAHESSAQEKLANETSDVETEGSLDSNIDRSTVETNHVNQTAEETNGMTGKDPLGMNTYRWGEKAPEDQPGTSGRRHDAETLSTSAEEINKEDNLDLLARSFNQFTEARRNAQSVVSQNLDHGKPGSYVTRSKTLLEKVQGTTGRR